MDLGRVEEKITPETYRDRGKQIHAEMGALPAGSWREIKIQQTRPNVKEIEEPETKKNRD